MKVSLCKGLSGAVAEVTNGKAVSGPFRQSIISRNDFDKTWTNFNINAFDREGIIKFTLQFKRERAWHTWMHHGLCRQERMLLVSKSPKDRRTLLRLISSHIARSGMKCAGNPLQPTCPFQRERAGVGCAEERWMRTDTNKG